MIEDNWIHDPIPCCGPAQPHTDSVQIPSGGSNITIRHNRIYGGYIDQSNFGNAAITMGGNVSGIVVDNNILAGGGFTIYCEQENLGGDGTPSAAVHQQPFQHHLQEHYRRLWPRLRLCRRYSVGECLPRDGRPDQSGIASDGNRHRSEQHRNPGAGGSGSATALAEIRSAEVTNGPSIVCRSPTSRPLGVDLEPRASVRAGDQRVPDTCEDSQRRSRVGRCFAKAAC